MSTTRRRAVGLVGGVLLVALVAGAALLDARQTAASAAPAKAQASPTISRDQTAQLVGAAMGRFAARLGTNEAGVNAAFVGAVDDTMDQAVRDGTLTQAQADEVKAQVAQEGLSGVVLRSTGAGESQPAAQPADKLADDQNLVIDAVWQEAATTLGLTPAQLKSEVVSGRSIAVVAQAQGIAIQQVRDAMLAAGKSTLAGAVKDGRLTQAQADEQERALPALIDQMISAARQSR